MRALYLFVLAVLANIAAQVVVEWYKRNGAES